MNYIEKLRDKIVELINNVDNKDVLGQRIKFTDVPDPDDDLETLLTQLKEKYNNINFKIKADGLFTNVTWLYKDKVSVKNINE